MLIMFKFECVPTALPHLLIQCQQWKHQKNMLETSEKYVKYVQS